MGSCTLQAFRKCKVSLSSCTDTYTDALAHVQPKVQSSGPGFPEAVTRQGVKETRSGSIWLETPGPTADSNPLYLRHQ